MAAYFLVGAGAFHDQRVVAAGDRALGVWLRVGTWCVQFKQSFDVHPRVFRAFGGTKLIGQRLVDAPLWRETEHGWQYLLDPSLWTYEFETPARTPISEQLRAAVLERDSYSCRICGTSDDLQMDHIHPWSRGGRTTYENLQALCGPCNRAKGAKV